MPLTTLSAQPVSGERTIGALFIILAVAWLLLITQTRHHWGSISYYNFGWAVPFLSAYLLFLNLQNIPPRQGRLKEWTVTTATALLLILVPFHAFSEVNPFWRAPLWIQGGLLALYSLIVVNLLFGKQGIRRSLYPMLLLSTMIPWPYRIETAIIQSLTEVVSNASLQALLFMGFPFVLSGNSLLMGDIQVGVNEACSGIRSLQALFMVTLFSAGLMRISVWARFLTLLALPFLVIAMNTARAVFLSLQIVFNGNEAYEKWHDPAGLITFAISMISLIVLLTAIGSLFPARLNDHNAHGEIISPPGKTLWILFVLPLLPYGLVEGWFRIHEHWKPPTSLYAFEPERISSLSIQALDIHPRIASVLGYSYGSRFKINQPREAIGELYFYGYTPDNKIGSVSSYGHSPLICMEAIGAKLETRFPALNVTTASHQENLNNSSPASNDARLRLSHALFADSADRKIHVFWQTIEADNKGIAPERLAILNYGTQLELLKRGRRNFSRQVVLLSLHGALPAQEARRLARQIVQESLRPRPTGIVLSVASSSTLQSE